MNPLDDGPRSIADAYPAARNAVAFYEQGDIAHLELIRALGWSVERVCQMATEVHKKQQTDLLGEVQTNDFKKYIASKLGLM